MYIAPYAFAAFPATDLLSSVYWPKRRSLTANAMKGDREKCINAGMNDYLAKPFIAHKALADVLEKWL